MSFTMQPLSLLPLPGSLESKAFSIQEMQKAVALQPSLASQAAGQTMGANSIVNASSNLLSPMALNPLNGMKSHSDEEMKTVAKNFEKIFMRMLFKEMRNTVEKSGFVGNSQAMDFFETMRDDQLSEQLASSGGIGIGNIIYQRLKDATVPHLKTIL
jgi:hypothetical protein